MRFFGADVAGELKTIATAELNTMLELIKTERADTGLELINRFNIGICERQFPELTINMQNSKLQVDELNLDITDTPEEYPAELIISFKDNTDKIALRVEYYIEALQRVFHGYKSSDISWIEVTETIRADAYTEKMETFKVAGIMINVRIL